MRGCKLLISVTRALQLRSNVLLSGRSFIFQLLKLLHELERRNQIAANGETDRIVTEILNPLREQTQELFSLDTVGRACGGQLQTLQRACGVLSAIKI